MPTSPPCVAGVSDVSLGYGSPQLPAFMRALGAHYPGVEVVVYEPDDSRRRYQPELFPGLRLVRLATRVPAYNSPRMLGTIEYVLRAAAVLNRRRPAVLVLSSPMVLPVLRRLRYRPQRVIYYMLESLDYISQFFEGRFFIDFTRQAARAGLIDLVVSVEENRAALDWPAAGLRGVPLAVVYNCINPPAAADRVQPARQRNGRTLYSGTIQKRLTYAEYYLRDEIAALPIDLYGLVEGPDREKLELRRQLEALQGALRYRGYVNARALSELRRAYAYSIVMWAPTNTHQYYASPNKFFEAVADGVVPITAPHPQCQMLVERYGCGLVMPDWSFEAFRETLQIAQAGLRSGAHAEMVENCRTAVRAELNWPAQFAKLTRHLPAAL